jgi:ABC-type uncharacterized transport system substrate-binding protein
MRIGKAVELRLGTLLLLALAGVAWAGSPADVAAQRRVLIYFDAGSRVHRDFMDGFRAGSADARLGADLAVREVALDGPAAASEAPAGEGGVDLVVAVGSRITQRLLDDAPAPPLLSAMVPRSSYRELVGRDEPRRARKSTAVFLDQPIGRQFALAGAVKPGLSAVGVLLSHANRHQWSLLEGVARRRGLTLNVEVVGEGTQIAAAIERLLAESEALIAIPDPVVVDPANAKWLLYMAYQRRVAVVGFSESFAKAGAVASVFSKPAQIGGQTAERLRLWADRGWEAIAGPVAPRPFEVATNESAARALGLELPSRDQLRAAIAAAGEASP